MGKRWWWKKLGVSNAQRRVSRKTGVRLSRLGCMVPLGALLVLTAVLGSTFADEPTTLPEDFRVKTVAELRKKADARKAELDKRLAQGRALMAIPESSSNGFVMVTEAQAELAKLKANPHLAIATASPIYGACEKSSVGILPGATGVIVSNGPDGTVVDVAYKSSSVGGGTSGSVSRYRLLPPLGNGKAGAKVGTPGIWYVATPGDGKDKTAVLYRVEVKKGE